MLPAEWKLKPVLPNPLAIEFERGHTMKAITAPTLVDASALILSGCPAGLGSKDYSRDQDRSVQEVQMGIVNSVHEVNIEGTKSNVGTACGAVVGGWPTAR